MKFQDTAGLYSTLLTHMKLSSRFKQDFCDRFEKCFRSVFFQTCSTLSITEENKSLAKLQPIYIYT